MITTINTSGFHKQRGMTIMELMIGLSLGLVVSLGMIYLFIISKENMDSTSSINIMQENVRYANKMLQSTALQAGYRTPPLNTSTEIFDDVDDIFPSNAFYISATNNDGGNNSDSFTVRFQGSGDGAGTPDNDIRDCVGNGVDSFALSVNTYSITNNEELQCQAINNTTVPASDTTITLLDNVEAMQVLMGEDTDQDGYANRYVNPNHGDLNTDNIVSMKVAVLFRSNDGVAVNPDTTTYNLLGTTWNPTDDNRMRKMLVKTIQFRNVVP